MRCIADSYIPLSNFTVDFYMYRDTGAQVMLLEPTDLKNKYPWLQTDDLALGCLGKFRLGIETVCV